MPTTPRIIVPYQIYQVTSHGVDNLCLFRFRKIRTLFLRLLAATLKKFSMSCYTYSFTINHYYLVLRSTDEAISVFMQELNLALAKRYNRLMAHRDTVIGRRFDSIIAKEETGLSDLIRFVNLEPVRKNHCTLDELDHSTWSGHSTIMGLRQKSFIKRSDVLNHFGTSQPVCAYRDFIRNGFPDHPDDPILKLIRKANSGKGKQLILGDDDFVQKIHQMNKNAYAQVKRHITEKMNLEKIHSIVTDFLCLEKDMLFSRGRHNEQSTARELFAYTAARRFDFSNAEIARYLRVCRSAVSKMIARFEHIAQKELLKSEIELSCNLPLAVPI